MKYNTKPKTVTPTVVNSQGGTVFKKSYIYRQILYDKNIFSN